MTSSHTPDRPAAAGVFVVRDPAVCTALEQLLAPHRTTETPAGDGDEILARARAHAGSAIAIEPPVDTTIENILDNVYAAAHLAGRAKAKAENRNSTNELQGRARRAEAALAPTERDLDETRQQLQDALSKIAELESRPAPSPTPAIRATGARAVDRQTWEALAVRMDRQAAPLEKKLGDMLRIASRAVHDEVEKLYGGSGKKES